MVFTKTWIKDTYADTSGIYGYNAVHICRPYRKGGGVALYIRDLFYMNNVLETVFSVVDTDLFGMNNKALIGVIYRPPDTDM